MDALTQRIAEMIAAHPEQIELGLDRVRAVWEMLGRPRPAPVCITVAGTNGKGSTIAFLEAILRAAGYRVASYTSPHLQRFNERIRIDGEEADDQALLAALECIAAHKAAIPLTFFEHTTLVAFKMFAEAEVDVALLEVGLGGRLDAVNLIDADAAIITGIDLDHTAMLGNTREQIGREKAGIFRAGRPAIVADPDPPESLRSEAERVGAVLMQLGTAFRYERGASDWHWIGAGTSLRLPRPSLLADVQHGNAAAAIAALVSLRGQLHVPFRAMRTGVSEARIAGRLEHHRIDGIEVVFDVAHNPQAACVLAAWLRAHRKPTRAVFSCLADKDAGGILAPLVGLVEHWHLTSLAAISSRASEVSSLRGRLQQIAPAASSSLHPEPPLALEAALSATPLDGRVLVFGSFLTVSATRAALVRLAQPA